MCDTLLPYQCMYIHVLFCNTLFAVWTLNEGMELFGVAGKVLNNNYTQETLEASSDATHFTIPSGTMP